METAEAAGQKMGAFLVMGLLLGISGTAVGFAVGKFGQTTPQVPDDNTGGNQQPVNATVMIMNFKYDPDPVTVPAGSTVTWKNHDSVIHTVTSDQSIGPLNSPDLQTDQTYSYTFATEGDYYYHCTPHATMVDSHASGRAYTGMVGLVKVTKGSTNNSTPGDEPLPAPRPVTTAEVGRDAADVPAPINRTAPTTVEVFLESKQVTAMMDTNVTYTYWTFNGTVPGPMIRVMVNDTVVLHLHNADTSVTHSIDLHAVMGPGGGAAVMQVPAGQTMTFTFKAMREGVYVYHCATPPVDWHIANGMYGLIVVEPEGGLPPVDKEFYVMQGEFYTNGEVGEVGHHSFDADAMHAEHPTYVVFNGRKGSLTGSRMLTSEVNDTVRIFFGVGGPNLVSSFHGIGQIWDRVYPEGDLLSPPHRNIQTTLVPAGGAAVVEFVTLVPGMYILVDHSISRTIYRGSLGMLQVTGPDDPTIFHSGT